MENLPNIQAIIVEDEIANRENLRYSLSKYCPNVEIVAEASSAIEGIDIIQKHQPDLVFLDIEMPNGNGFEMLASIGQINFEVIFVTAYDQYALKAIKFSALDYLLKPVRAIELKAAITQVVQKRKREADFRQMELLLQNRKNINQARSLALPGVQQVSFVQIEEIIFCKGDNNYTHFHLDKGQHILVSQTLKEYETLLENHEFLRVHQSYLVNLRHVKAWVKSDGGYLLMSNGEQIRVSRHRKEKVAARIGKLF